MTWIAIAGALLFFVGVLVSIALHELGHMLPAKLFDVRVTQFMVGFGTTLWSRRRGETEYGVKLFPLGGFVRMIGMFPPARDGRMRRSSTGPFQQLIEETRRASQEDVPPGEEHRLFYTKKWWQKLIVMAGGPLTNVVIATVLFAIVLMGFGAYVLRPQVAAVSDCTIPATAARDNCLPDDPPSPAREAGFQRGDRIVAFEGRRVESWEQLSRWIRDAGAGPVSIQVVRDGERKTLRPDLIAAERQSLEDPDETVTVGFLGLEATRVREQQGPAEVAAYMGELTLLTGEALLHIPERMVGVTQAAFGGAERQQDSPMSVIGASRVAGQIATLEEVPVADRIATFIQWLGAVNLFLAVFNFVPLLPLDGGHMAGALWEGLRRGFARVFRRPDPGHVDVAKAMPLAYGVAGVMLIMGVLLLYADIVNPVRLVN